MPFNISYSWSKVLLPGNRGDFKAIYANTQPKLHRSIESWHVVTPNNAYGGLYHLEATYYVKTPSLLF